MDKLKSLPNGSLDIDMIKIAYIIDTILVETGGTEKQLLMLMNNLDREKFKPHLCVLGRSAWLENEYKGDPYFVARISSFKRPDVIGGILRLARYLKQERIDIVQTFFNDANKAGILAAKIAGVKCVVSSRRNQGYWHTKGELAILKLFNRWVDMFIANSHSTRDWALQAEGIPAKQIEVIYNGLDFSRYGQNREQLRAHYRRELGLSEDALVIGMVANLRPVKGHETLLQAAQRVIEQIPYAQFILVGEGVCEEGLRTLSRNLGIAKNVHFLGQRTDVANLLNAFDIGALSSNSESSSNATVEYLATGLPVVSTDVGGAREAIDDGWTGFVVAVGDYEMFAERILDICRHNRFSEMGIRGRRRAEELYSQVSMLRRHEETYQQLVHSCSPETSTTPPDPEWAELRDPLIEFIRKTAKLTVASVLGQRPLVRIVERFDSNKIVILMYHRINDAEDTNGLSISNQYFEQQLKYLKSMYPIISLEEAVSRLESGVLDQNYIVLTFDDGFQDNYTTAYPLLQKYDIPATIFIACQAVDNGIYDWSELDESIMGMTDDYLDLPLLNLNNIPVQTDMEKKNAIKLLHSTLKGVDHSSRRAVIESLAKKSDVKAERVIMTWSQANELAQSGLVTIAAHTVTHPILSKISSEQAVSEIYDSKKIIENRIGTPVMLFSYPNGGGDDFNDETVTIVKSAGYRAACTTVQGVNPPGTDLFRLRRIDVTYGICRGATGRFSQSLFAAYISGAIDKLKVSGKTAWRSERDTYSASLIRNKDVSQL